MSGKKQIYRLFKVAKELNVGTTLLVEHLQENGHDVSPSPNTKLSDDQYDILLKEFASEKLMKEKAAQLNERRREDVRPPNGNGHGHAEETPVKSEDDDRNDGITAADLRNQIFSRQTPTPEKEEEVKPEQEKNPAPQPESKTEAPVEEKNTPEPEKKQDEGDKGGLRVIGKIDLDQVGKGRSKSENKAKESAAEKPADQPKEKPAAQEQPAPEEKPEVVAPKAEKKETPKAKSETKELPKQETSEPPAEEKPVEPPKPKQETKPEEVVTPVAKDSASTPAEPDSSPAEENKPQTTSPLAETKQDKPTEKTTIQYAESNPTQQSPIIESHSQIVEAPTAEHSESKESGKSQVVRAEDNAPKLSGLKVMGKIELPGDKRKKKKEEETNKASTTEEDDKPKKRRRRRRKRKRKGEGEGTPTPQGQGGTADNTAGGNRDRSKGVRKEKPSKQEVDQSIKTTLSQLGKGPSRNRQRLRREKRDTAAARREAMEQRAAESAMTLELTEFITANELANLINVPVNEIITKSFELGMMISINQRLDAELLTLLAGDYGYSAEFVDVTEGDLEIEEEEDNPEDILPRAPIITVMGHVDHGKTTLLDYLRKANVAAGEAGGITQHIGAYTVSLQNGQKVTFLDTPGHEAFTAMRARGAKVTDVAIIVVAADDAVMPQTKEAISHAQAAELPMVFALNKIDKAGANPDRIRTQLAEMDILVEDWGGKFQSQEISALKGQNVEDLLEKVIFESDLLELKANPDRLASGTVIESRLDKGRGTVVTMLVEKGTLRVGDPMVVGIHYGKVRAMIDQNGERVKEAGPATPVQILGVGGQPTAGDKFYVFAEESKAKEISQRRSELFRQQQLRNTNRLTLEEIGRRRALGSFEELNVIIRGDVDGSVEALAGSLLKLSTEEVQVNIIQKAVGAITEADINLAIASEAVVIAFNVRPIAKARQLAERESVDIKFYSVIYDAINDVRDALEGLLSPELRQEITGTAEIKEVFKITKVGNIAGCLVTSGKIERNNPVRIIRDGVVVHEGKLISLKRFKDDAKEVASGQECGMMIDNYNDIKVGDEIESYKVNEIRRKL
jgi:translation initiation factor IF-2